MRKKKEKHNFFSSFFPIYPQLTSKNNIEVEVTRKLEKNSNQLTLQPSHVGTP